ncbi:monofunctional biosynthetic peptidoglycan transglycosylase [Methyloceanibacter sp. wino2]|uniref:monofunctional biosynthetic peptidoglycan transglycosylase n=1 Tax=Methyloceanibacter sp. wino2 TaxID=2170729 RepID=UPI001FE1CEFA|nr:monofunctional biosynthetic peptidoglycan transglycosylase [Methyloceanibacter sp. wino2]
MQDNETQDSESQDSALPTSETGNAIPTPEVPSVSDTSAAPRSEMKSRGKKSWAKRHPWLRRIGLALLILVGVVLASLVLFRFVNPPITSVMVIEKLRGETLQRRWVPIEKISPHMRLAVIASEDGNFCRHQGVDWAAVRQVLESAKNLEPARGASTIPMQVAKNIYLWEFRSYLRKALEVPLAYALVTLWPKERVLEVYLNIAQFGPGLFGVEAASRKYFRKPASALTQREAVLLATTLPKPKVRNPARPNRTHRVVANAVQKRLPYIAKRADCVLNP